MFLIELDSNTTQISAINLTYYHVDFHFIMQFLRFMRP